MVSGIYLLGRLKGRFRDPHPSVPLSTVLLYKGKIIADFFLGRLCGSFVDMVHLLRWVDVRGYGSSVEGVDVRVKGVWFIC